MAKQPGLMVSLASLGNNLGLELTGIFNLNNNRKLWFKTFIYEISKKKITGNLLLIWKLICLSDNENRYFCFPIFHRRNSSFAYCGFRSFYLCGTDHLWDMFWHLWPQKTPQSLWPGYRGLLIQNSLIPLRLFVNSVAIFGHIESYFIFKKIIQFPIWKKQLYK